MQIQVTFPKDESFGDLAGKTTTLPIEALNLGDNFVPKSALKEGYVPKANVETIVSERLEQQATNLRTTLAEDDEFTRSILESKGIKVGKDGKIVTGEGLTEEELAAKIDEQVRLKEAEWDKTVAAGLRSTTEAQTAEIQRLRRGILHAEIIDAAREAGVLKSQFEVLPNAPKHTMPVIAQTEGMYAWDDKNKAWALKKLDGTEGFEPSPDANASRPYAGPSQFWNGLKTNEAIAPRWFGDGSPPAKDLGDTDTSGGNSGSGDSGSGGDGTDLAARQAALRKAQTQSF